MSEKKELNGDELGDVSGGKGIWGTVRMRCDDCFYASVFDRGIFGIVRTQHCPKCGGPCMKNVIQVRKFSLLTHVFY